MADDPAVLRAELEKLRTECDDRVAAMKKQQEDAKKKAMAIIQRQKEGSRKRVHSLEEDLRLRADQLEQLKQMLRDAESQKSALSDTISVLRDDLSQTNSREQDALSRASALDQQLSQLRHSADTSAAENVRLSDQLFTTKRELEDLRRAASALSAPSDTPATPSVEDESQTSTADPPSEDAASTVPSATPTPEQLAVQLDASRQRVNQLSTQLEDSRADANLCKQQYHDKLTRSDARSTDLQKRLDQAESSVSDLTTRLESAESALRREKEKAREMPSVDATKSADEQKKILEAKVSEMERIVVSKQAEVNKVRDKARTYLKELNAEKRALEENKKEELDAMRKQLDQERLKVSGCDEKVASVTKELENCLSVIREKQKSVQMLRMSITTHKDAADEAKRVTEEVRAEFTRYKERARLALQEKDSAGASSDADVEAATAMLRMELDKVRREGVDLRKRLEDVKGAQQQVEELRERAERAEAVADLLRNDGSGVGTATNFSQVDQLEERISKLDLELSAAQSAVEDANARHSSTKLRLDASEKALSNAEMRAKNSEEMSEKVVRSLQERIEELEKALKKAQDAAASAQRTAAAAAKALAFTAVEEDSGSRPGEGRRGTLDMAEVYDEEELENGGYNLDMEVKGTRTGLAAAIEKHSDRLGLSAGGGDEPDVGLGNGGEVGEERLASRDQQIAVMSTQLAELGALLDEVQQESQLRGEQTVLLKSEVKNLDAKLAAAEKLQNGAPFSYLRTIVVRYLETDDATLLPVIGSVLSFSEEEASKVKVSRGMRSSAAGAGTTSRSGYFGIPFLGSR